MKSDELNQFVKQYAKHDKTRTALMLTGEWGSGKSYYVNNELCPFLKRNSIKCVLVSLYGIDSISELAKQIYLRLRFPTFSKKSEVKETVSIIGLNILFNVLSLKGLSISVSERQLKRLYKSVNLNGILLIFEDLERSSINVIELLGFVNGLVEYDGAKVLLVANEEEFLCKKNNTEVSDDSQSKECIPLNEETGTKNILNDKYRKVKEKTIGDTVKFEPDVKNSIKSILSSFSGIWIDALIYEDEINKIKALIVSNCQYNLRLLIYACQKYNDIFSEVPKDIGFSKAFYQVSFEGMLIVSGRFVGSDIPNWAGNKQYSAQLGSYESPVFKFIYDYLRNGVFAIEDIIVASKEYESYLLFEEDSVRDENSDISIVENFYIHKEADVRRALQNIEETLNIVDFIGIYAYSRLAYYVIRAGEVIGYRTDKICSLMIRNAEKAYRDYTVPSNVIGKMLLSGFDSEYSRIKYETFTNDLNNVVERARGQLKFSYNPSDISDFYMEACRNKEQFILNNRFISCFDISKLVSMLLVCSAQQIDCFTGILFVFYRDVSFGEYDIDDIETLDLLQMKLNEAMSNDNNWDKIQRLQIDYLRKCIIEFIERMSE